MISISRRLDPVLPLFVVEAGDAAVLYAPGHLSRVRGADLPALVHELEGPGTASALGAVVRELRAAAEAAQRALAQRLDDPFAPVVLLLHLGQGGPSEGACCGVPSAGRARPRAWLPAAAVESGARRVAEACARSGLPFALVLHVDSEQPAELELARGAIEVTRRVAAECGLPWRAQAVLARAPSDAHVRWLAREVGSIVLWCDGSPEPMDRVCPAPADAALAASLPAAAAAVRGEGGHVEARIAVGPANVDRLGEILAHAVATLGAEAVSVEPLHAGCGPGRGGFAAEDASRFVASLLDAARVAGHLGVPLSWPGVELGELHGPPCGVLRDVLHLLPDGSVTACSLPADVGPCARPAIVIGRWDAAIGRLVVDERRIGALRRRAGALEGACRDCIGQSHCSRGCPGR
ncbi:MAG: hypothetical protein NDJ94_21870, partial [Vicinamibacteria bacterium]|nr:hypothetical protein [Vicinamibacteria bacterium]